MYHVRGAEGRKRVEGKSVPSTIRSQLFKVRMVPYAREALRIVATDHNAHHDGHNTAEVRLNERFKIPDLRAKVQAVGGNNCSVCAEHAPVPKKPVKPILTSRKGELVMFDLTQFYVPVTAHKTLFARAPMNVTHLFVHLRCSLHTRCESTMLIHIVLNHTHVTRRIARGTSGS
jgi:hypothetical protein